MGWFDFRRQVARAQNVTKRSVEYESAMTSRRFTVPQEQAAGRSAVVQAEPSSCWLSA